MAFIDGTVTRYECPLCEIKCTPKLVVSKIGVLKFVYYHAAGIPIDINGYPGVCANAGQELSEDEVNIFHIPNIIADRTNFLSTL